MNDKSSLINRKYKLADKFMKEAIIFFSFFVIMLVLSSSKFQKSISVINKDLNSFNFNFHSKSNISIDYCNYNCKNGLIMQDINTRKSNYNEMNCKDFCDQKSKYLK